ncbi:Sugar phosphate isomerase/epimerase [Collimonas sp. OK242]|uniref:sugar phosphate isomerase/epimerase n=1 Tax=Collimonas sp. OK242 TaxID=1798195 RepID=UPI000896C3D7|nr:sugar phosphate isomerase/epimerase [Collimonas sp. OK242]SDY78894.1 Sugar phosphate isomerase/epimerase [Collimonas sp. OK242]
MPSTMDIFIVASAYGVDFVRKNGHAALIPLAAGANANGLEIRRELFLQADDDIAPELAALKPLLAAHGLQAVYSAPESLFLQDGNLNLPDLAARLGEAETLGAATLKLQMHHYSGSVDVQLLRQALADSPVALLLENGQQDSGSRIAEFASFFTACKAYAPAIPVAMTFDIGNWSWAGENAIEAAAALASHVRYIHCKGVLGEGMRRFAVAPDDGRVDWRACLSTLPGHVPRAIEYPLPAGAKAQAAHVDRLRSACEPTFAAPAGVNACQ